MTTRRDAGFTLIEMLLALALTAVIATSALAALQMFVEYDARSIETMETQVDIERALHLLERDVVEADTLTFGVRQLTLTRADGTVTAYAFPLGGYELVRVVAANQVDMTTKLAAAQLASAAPQYDSRGRLRDGSYNASAIIQGATKIAINQIVSARNSAPIGANVQVGYAVGGTARTSACAATSLVLAESNAKP